MTDYWIEELGYSVENFSESGNLLEVLARLHDLDAARAPTRLTGQNIQNGCCTYRKAAGSCAGAIGMTQPLNVAAMSNAPPINRAMAMPPRIWKT
jgi:hypothetical protein